MASIILHTFGVGLLSTSLLATELTAQVRPERFCNGDIYIRASEKLSDMPVYKVVRMIGKVNGAKLVVFVMTHDSLGSTQALVEFFGTLEAVFYRSEDVSILVCLPLPHLACPNHSLEIIQQNISLAELCLNPGTGLRLVNLWESLHSPPGYIHLIPGTLQAGPFEITELGGALVVAKIIAEMKK